MLRYLVQSRASFKSSFSVVCLFGVLHFYLGNVVRAQDDIPFEIPEFEQLLAAVKNGTREEREQAAAMLIEYPGRIADFAEPLAALFVIHDESLNRVADSVFRYLGEDTIDAIDTMYHPEKNATSTDNEKWRKVCGSIRAVGEPARARFEPRLLKLLDESNDTNLRAPAILALTGFDGGSPKAIEKILVDLAHEDFNVTLVALRLVIKTGANAHAALEPVRKLFDDGNLSQRSLASTALGAMGPVDEYDPLKDLTPLLDVFYLVVRERSLTGIGLLGPHAATVEPKVREMMMETNSNLEARGTFVLWQITGNTSDTVPRLIELSKVPDFEIAALQFMGEMGSAAVDAVDYLCERSKNIDPSIRCESIVALARISPNSDLVKRRFDELRNDPHPVVRLSVRLVEKTGR